MGSDFERSDFERSDFERSEFEPPLYLNTWLLVCFSDETFQSHELSSGVLVEYLGHVLNYKPLDK